MLEQLPCKLRLQAGKQVFIADKRLEIVISALGAETEKGRH